MNTTEKIWHEYQNKLFAFIRSRVASDVADDIIQDVFMKVHTRMKTLNDESKLESWLYQITRNAITDYYRSNKLIGELPDWVGQPESDEAELIKIELSSCLEPMIKRLPDKYREAVQLSEIEKKTQKEVAELVGISLSGAKSRVQRGRALLKNMLYECCQIEVNKNKQLIAYDKKDKNCKFC